MAEVERPRNVAELTGRYLLDGPAGILFHGMLFPDVYPSEREAVKMLSESDDAPPLIGEEYPKTLGGLAVRGVVVQQLTVLREPGYNGSYGRILKEAYAPLISGRLLDVRVADYTSFRDGLQQACGDTPIVGRYDYGVETGDPKASFWAAFPLEVRSGGALGDPSLIATMDYQNGIFDGMVVRRRPFQEDLLQFVNYCRLVFKEQAQPIQGPEA